jgi:hypothetical protein
MKNDEEENDIRPINYIIDDLFDGKDIPEHEFLFFQTNVRLSKITSYNIFLECKCKSNALLAWDNKSAKVRKTLPRIFRGVVTYPMKRLPLYINYPFKEILEWRFNHNI